MSSQIKKMITDYNEQEGEPLTWQAAIDLHYQGQQDESSSVSVSHEIMHQAVGHLRHLKRSREEIICLRCEMSNCLTFYQDKIEQLENIQQQLTSGCVSRLNLGSLNLVKKQLHCDGNRLLELQHTFSRWISIGTEQQPVNHLPNHNTSPPSSSLSISSPPPTLSTKPPSPRVFNHAPSSSPFVPHNSFSRFPCEPSSSSDGAASLSTRGHTLHSTSNSQSTGHQPTNILPGLSSNHNTSSSLSIPLFPPILSIQPPLKQFNFTPSSPFVPPHSHFVHRRFPCEPKSLFKSSSSSSNGATTPHSSCLRLGHTLHSTSDLQATQQSSKSDTVSCPMNTNKQSLSRLFQDDFIQYHESVREPETGKQQSEFSGCSDDDESSGEEEVLPKQYWRAERFHMEEFLQQMRVKFTISIPTLT